MLLGAHISSAGGLFKAFQRAEDIGCETMLIFTKSNRQWRAKPLTEQDIAKFKSAQTASSVSPVAVHATYLINIASPKPDLWEKSYQLLKTEVERCDALGIPYLTFHPGSHMKMGNEAGMERIAQGLRRLLTETAECETVVCLETMAGQGTNLGHAFNQLATMLTDGDPGGLAHRLGVCFDTCHVFAAGYDLRTPTAYTATLAEFDSLVGLDRIKCFHFNDSQFDFGTRRDRHAHIGEGFIGLDGFANFVNDPRWASHPAHLETPKVKKHDDGTETEMDGINLARLRELVK